MLSILGACDLGTQVKNLYTCVEEKPKFFVNYDKSLQQKFSLWALKNM